MEQVLGQHAQSECSHFGQYPHLCFVFENVDSNRIPKQNRAYAANQLADLHQKLSKAQSGVPSTRPPQPILIDEKAVIKVAAPMLALSPPH